ncbi:MAG: hypothetical protein RBT70_08820 [Alphaproteobacteria bacterium]|jgi:hypothetical protein|nr:hypothetical protein [Alphaproteobacteria bacterium]
MAYDSSNPEAVKDAKRKAYHLNEREANGIAKICNDPDCRFVLASFLEQANIFHTAFNPNPSEHAFNEGYRNAGLWWLNKALLHDKEIMAKIQADKDFNQKAGNYDDDRNDSDTSGE